MNTQLQTNWSLLSTYKEVTPERYYTAQDQEALDKAYRDMMAAKRRAKFMNADKYQIEQERKASADRKFKHGLARNQVRETVRQIRELQKFVKPEREHCEIKWSIMNLKNAVKRAYEGRA